MTTPRTTTTADAHPAPAPLRRGRVVALAVATAALLLAACGGGAGGEATGPTLPADAATVLAASAEAMGEVDSVAFALTRGGAPVYIDSFESISLNTVDGQFTVPRAAQAVLEVEVNGSLTTELGAVALDDEVWLSNPVTGEFETLPPGYDIDPSLFFDPENGWRPLMANLTDITLVGTEQRDGAEHYHVRGTAPAEQVEIITARLVRGEDVEIYFWLHPVTGLVTRAEFSTHSGNDTDDTTIDWSLHLFDYGDEFSIDPPAVVGDS